jgi:hypothetical protein
MTKILCLSLLAFCGCAQLSSRQTETIAPDGSSTRVTRLRVTTFFDAKSEIAKLRSTTTDKTQGLTVGGLSEGSSGTNAVNAIKSLADLVNTLKGF